MYDKIEKIGDSTIQHGKTNNRIYLQKLSKSDYPEIVDRLDKLAAVKIYTKISAKVPGWAVKRFQQEGYISEAYVPKFYNGKEDGFFVSNFIDHTRSILDIHQREEIDHNIQIAVDKKNEPLTVKYNPEFSFRVLEKKDIPALVNVYKEVFKTYPFPIFNEEYIAKTMDENIVYFGAFDKNKLIAASSAEMDIKAQNVEMTDFATLPGYRGHGLAVILLKEMEAEMRKRKIYTFYTIARAYSPAMNITFAKMQYNYSGTMINNTNISGRIESMNVWYKFALH